MDALMANRGEHIDALMPELDAWDVAHVWASSYGLPDVGAPHFQDV